MKKDLLAASLAVLAVLAAGPTSATAADGSVHPDVQAIIEEVPGGVVLAYHHAVWPALDMELTVPVGKAVNSCSTGSVCAFSDNGAVGNKLSWGSCSTHTIPGTFTVKSIANARSAGSILQARNGTTVLTSATSGTWKNVAGSTTNVRCLE